jgi:hypothetical protein
MYGGGRREKGGEEEGRSMEGSTCRESLRRLGIVHEGVRRGRGRGRGKERKGFHKIFD